MSREAKILTAILVVVVGGMIALFSLANKGTPATKVTDAGKLVRSDSHAEGTGKVQVVEFGDFQCPACGAAYPNVKQVVADYAANVTFYFRNFPLTQLHPNAAEAALAAEAAGAQGKYWQYHDALYDNQKAWADLADPTDSFVSYAKNLGLDTAKFQSALQNKTYQSKVDTDVADGTALGINATPTIYINGKAVSAFDYATLRDAIKAAIGS